MANLETEQTNTSASPMPNIVELGETEALSKVTGAGMHEAVLTAIPWGIVGATAGMGIGAAITRNETKSKIGAAVGGVSGVALGAAIGSRLYVP